MIDPIAELESQASELGSQRELAKKMRVSAGYLSEVLSKRKGIGDKVLSYLGLQVTYERAASKLATTVPRDTKRLRERRYRAANPRTPRTNGSSK